MSEQRADFIPHGMTLEQCHDAILQSLMQGTAGHYRIGLLYNHIVENRLAVNQGYRTTREYFRRHVRVLSQPALTRYGEVARSFHLPVVEKYGMARLGALLEYLRLAHIWLWQIDQKDPGSTPIEVPRRGGLKLTKTFADCTVEEVRRRSRRGGPGRGMGRWSPRKSRCSATCRHSRGTSGITPSAIPTLTARFTARGFTCASVTCACGSWRS